MQWNKPVGEINDHLNLELSKKETNSIMKLTEEHEKKQNDELVDAMTDDVLDHGPRDERFGATVWLPFQKGLCWHLSGECERCKRVHDQIHPQHLNCLREN